VAVDDLDGVHAALPGDAAEQVVRDHDVVEVEAPRGRELAVDQLDAGFLVALDAAAVHLGRHGRAGELVHADLDAVVAVVADDAASAEERGVSVEVDAVVAVVDELRVDRDQRGAVLEIHSVRAQLDANATKDHVALLGVDAVGAVAHGEIPQRDAGVGEGEHGAAHPVEHTRRHPGAANGERDPVAHRGEREDTGRKHDLVTGLGRVERRGHRRKRGGNVQLDG
jgi:hypothetical protein